MKISFSLDVDDLMSFFDYSYQCQENRSNRRKIRLISVGLAAIITLWLYNSMPDNPVLVFSVGAVLVLNALFLLPIAMKRQLGRNYKKQLIYQGNSKLMGHRDMIVDDQGVKVIWENGEESVTWDAVKSVDEIKDYFYIQIPQAYIIPKQKITPAEVEELSSLFARHIAVNSFESKK